MEERARAKQVKRVLIVALVVNVSSAVAKLGWGYSTSTLGLVADGFHSLLDSCASVIGLVGITLAAEPPDREHQYGHRKFEVLSSMGISLFIFLGAFEIVREAGARLLESRTVDPRITWVSFAVAAASFATGLVQGESEARRGRELGSPVLDADAAHTRSDVFGSVAVLAGLAVARYVHPIADAVVALGLGIYIVRVGYRILMGGLEVIADRAVLDPLEVQRVAKEFAGVLGTAKIRTRGEEAHTFLDMILLVDPKLTVAEAHDIVDRVEARLGAVFPGLRDVVIHVEPAGVRPSDEQRLAS